MSPTLADVALTCTRADDVQPVTDTVTYYSSFDRNGTQLLATGSGHFVAAALRACPCPS